MMEQSKTVQTFLKAKGLHAGVVEPLRAKLAPRATLTPRAAAFTDRLLDGVAAEAAKIPPGETWLASSDIIEIGRLVLAANLLDGRRECGGLTVTEAMAAMVMQGDLSIPASDTGTEVQKQFGTVPHDMYAALTI